MTQAEVEAAVCPGRRDRCRLDRTSRVFVSITDTARSVLEGAQAFRTQTGLCRHSNQSLFAGGNSAGKEFGEARDWAGFFGDTRRFRGQRPRRPASPAAKPRKVKDYSEGARKSELRRTAWRAHQGSNLGPADKEARDLLGNSTPIPTNSSIDLH
jgi:hypothetical protein